MRGQDTGKPAHMARYMTRILRVIDLNELAGDIV